MQTKEYILTNAVQLLNRQGATPTSLRQIASYLEMSDGNLRYHFRTKEALISAMVEQMLEEMALIALTEKPVGKLSLKLIREQLRAVFFTMYRYRFIFLEGPLLMKQYQPFRNVLSKEILIRKEFLHALLFTQQMPGSIISEEVKELLIRKAEQLFIISDNWIKYLELSEYTSSISIDDEINHYVNLCLSLLPTEQF